MRRRLFLGGCWFAAAGAHAVGEARVAEVWIDLSLPALSSAPPGSDAPALKRDIETQQDRVMARLRALGAEEIGRVKVLRNALAVRLPAAQLPAARALPEVTGVRVVRDIQRPPPKGVH